MHAPSPLDLAESERDEFLGIGGTGVLALSNPEEEAPHAIPVSYGYDAADEVFYFRLVAGATRSKGDLTNRPVTLVVYGNGDVGWRSVVASGRLERTTDSKIATETLAGLERVHIPSVDVFGEPTDDLQFEFYRLVPTALSGRKETRTTP